MCGINGFYSKISKNLYDIISRMNDALLHRGPDNNGVWLDSNSGIVLGHQRLSILDLSNAGNQPMHSNSARYVLTYNGEIYNHLEIRKELEKSNNNIKWRGNSDTETLLEAIDFWGNEITLQKLEGMFSFGLWDKKKRCLILARDRIGEKPLYYGWQGEGENKVFLFSSEIKGLKAHPEFKAKTNRDAISLQLRHNCIPAPYSIYKNIYKLFPGNYLEVSKDELEKGLLPNSKTYWSSTRTAIYGNNNQLKISDEEIQNELEYCIKLSVKKQMISDVPLGAFLSGGTDSSLIVALMQSLSKNPIKSFTIGFAENDYDESKYAQKISKYLGTDHTELYVSPKEAMDVIPKISKIYDEPFSVSSQIPTYLVSQLAKENVKVALSGDGADELFCGYNRYTMSQKFLNFSRLAPLSFRKFLASVIKFIPPQKWSNFSKYLLGPSKYTNFGDKIHKGADILKADTLNDYYYMLCSHWRNPEKVVINSKEPKTLLTDLKPELKKLNNQEQMMALDFITYLPDDILVKVDRAAMSCSLETRAPFLDHKLIEYSWRIPHSLKFRNGKGKWILKEILKKYIPKNLVERDKMGFGVPIGIWLRGPLRDWAENLLNEKRLKQEGYFNYQLIQLRWAEHLSGKKNWQYELWDILMFQAWIEEQNY